MQHEAAQTRGAHAIELAPMSSSEFERYCERAISEYAAEHIRSGRWSAEDGYERAKQEYQDLLPDGVATPNQYLYTLKEAATQTAVGILWYALQTQAGQPVAFIYDIAIDPAFRRKGYATQAFHALEDQARSQGMRHIRLHVFGHNHAARALYEKLGYLATNIMMMKSLDQ